MCRVRDGGVEVDGHDKLEISSVPGNKIKALDIPKRQLGEKKKGRASRVEEEEGGVNIHTSTQILIGVRPLPRSS